jgi:hypothetical protein
MWVNALRLQMWYDHVCFVVDTTLTDNNIQYWTVFVVNIECAGRKLATFLFCNLIITGIKEFLFMHYYKCCNVYNYPLRLHFLLQQQRLSWSTFQSATKFAHQLALFDFFRAFDLYSIIVIHLHDISNWPFQSHHFQSASDPVVRNLRSEPVYFQRHAYSIDQIKRCDVGLNWNCGIINFNIKKLDMRKTSDAAWLHTHTTYLN